MNPLPPRPTNKPPVQNQTKLLEDPIFEGSREESIIHPDFYGFNLITGFRGKGKSTLLESWDHPSNILMLDFESKEQSNATHLGINAYFPIMRELISKVGVRVDPVIIYERVIQILNSIPQDRFTVLAIDNAQEFQEGCIGKIKSDESLQRLYGLIPQNVQSGAMGGAIPAAKRLIGNMIHLAYSKGIKVVSASFQLKPAWVKSQPAFNKWSSTNVSIWHEQSKFTGIMVDPMPEHFPIPRILVFKEGLKLSRWDDKLKRTVHLRRLPLAIPRGEAHEIYNYLSNPADFKHPKKGESIIEGELDPYTPTFSREQLILWERILRMESENGERED